MIPEIKALTFDTGGTILDWHGGISAALAKAGARQRYVIVSFTILTTSLIIDIGRRNAFNWDCVVSCEMIGSYKPNPEAYQTCARWLGLKPSEVLMVACHNFDLRAARKVGHRSAFVRRPQEWGTAGPLDPTPDASHDIVVDTFGDLAETLGC